MYRFAGTAAAAFLLLTAAVLSDAAGLLRVDAALSEAVGRLAAAQPLWLGAMRAVTMTGSMFVLGPATAVLAGILLWRRRPRPAAFAVLAMAGVFALRFAVATAIGRPRPEDQLAPVAGFSFPSGHTTTSATFAVVLVLTVPPLLRSWRARRALILAAAAWACTVALSRVALVVHWPSDVLGGWLFVAATVAALIAAWPVVGSGPVVPRPDRGTPRPPLS